ERRACRAHGHFSGCGAVIRVWIEPAGGPARGQHRVDERWRVHARELIDCGRARLDLLRRARDLRAFEAAPRSCVTLGVLVVIGRRYVLHTQRLGRNEQSRLAVVSAFHQGYSLLPGGRGTKPFGTAVSFISTWYVPPSRSITQPDFPGTVHTRKRSISS